MDKYADLFFTLLVGITIFALFLFRREDREYLWFSILLLASAANAALHFLVGVQQIAYSMYGLLDVIAGAAAAIAALAFFSIILHLQRSFWWWAACVAAAVSPLSTASLYFQWIGVAATNILLLCCYLPAYVWIVAALIVRTFKKDRSARLLLGPAVLFYGFEIVYIACVLSWQLGWQKRLQSVSVQVFERPFPTNLSDVIHYIFILALLIFLVRRFSLARQEEARLSSEIESARTMQFLLVPSTAPETSGFRVESVYIPASEVGGDFFHLRPAEDDSLLVVIGDVSGKGLAAAMTVSTITGALRNEMSRQPAEILAHLNRVLHGQIGGFVTCCISFISSDGAMTIANAGHLSPYRNGEEVAVEAGLPLGILPEGSYEESYHQLAVGDRLTFMSDGVIEARNVKGELYGFERTQQISNRSASAIAEIANHFGQEDDITVLSVEFSGAREAVSA